MTTVTAMYEAWAAPWLADPFDEAAGRARTAQTRELAAAVLGAPLAAQVGPLRIVSAGWSRETAACAKTAGEAGSPAWYAALGAHEHVTLTADGRSACREAWCQCPESPADGWVFYEGWTARGRVAHGFVCPACRRIVQSG